MNTSDKQSAAPVNGVGCGALLGVCYKIARAHFGYMRGATLARRDENVLEMAERLAENEEFVALVADKFRLDWLDENAACEASEWLPAPKDTPGSRLWYRVSFHAPVIGHARAAVTAAMGGEPSHEHKLAELRAAAAAHKAERETLFAQIDEAVATHRALHSPNK